MHMWGKISSKCENEISCYFWDKVVLAQSVELLTIKHIFSIDFIILGKCTSDDTNWSCCSTDHKCGIGKGDCDKDADCESGLKCGHDKFCSNDFPNKWYDCCYNPGKLVYIIVLNLF